MSAATGKPVTCVSAYDEATRRDIFKEVAPLAAKISEILAKHGVDGMVSVTVVPISGYISVKGEGLDDDAGNSWRMVRPNGDARTAMMAGPTLVADIEWGNEE